ncbi:MAG: methylated-DNA--[protein]-cysteine S-methyltransferase [Bacteroidaceae bacterium]|nr:methylated-DNA--[protein]-cysteine S-methyltransferase [Bacteroidaceae bacterium]
MKEIRLWDYESPVGRLVLGDADGQLCLCDWPGSARHEAVVRRVCRALGAETRRGQTELLRRAATQLDEYFGMERRAFDLPLLMVGTAFQKAVWQALLELPYGTVATYGELAAMLCARGVCKRGAARAVGAAVGANGMSVVVPCHRVLAAGVSLGGYAGGLPAKRFLNGIESLARVQAGET